MSFDFKQAQSIFLQAVEKSDSEDQARYLDEVCGDDQELRNHLEVLLDAHNQSGVFLEQGAFVSPSVNLSALDELIAEKIGSQIGPYRLLRKIDEGGMGVVYVAQQSEPVARRVALKIIKPGMDTRRVIARFEAERQALAMMDHPNIAKIFDGGETDSGRPYFVMELVKGIPITQYCDKHHLTPRQRLDLFVPVCQAVQHAHQKGIIHRDIKPSNVLVAEFDDRAVPKVIDFGLAKAVDQRMTEKTMFTQLGQVVGTFDYMSPEQTKLNQLDIDTRSDIYSLGVLLYELLTGETPFDRERLRSAAFDELLRIIREEEAPRPSLRLSSSEALPSIAANRHVEPKKLSTLVRGELDWIVMKALEKDRSRRYETASGFGRDVERYLSDEAVEARPPSARYRFGKFARRNRGVIATAGVILGVLLAGLASTSWQAIRANRAERSAQISLEQAETQRLRAEENLEQAHQTVRDYLTIVSDSEELALPALQTLRSELLGSVLGYYEQFLNQRTSDPHLRLEMAAIYMRVAQIHNDTDRLDDAIAALVSAIDILEQLRRDHPDVARCPSVVAGFWRGRDRIAAWDVESPTDSQLAMTALRRAIDLWEKFVAECPTEAGFRMDLAALYIHSADLVASYFSYGGVSLPAGSMKTAEQHASRAVELLDQLVREYPQAPQYRAGLVLAYGRSAQVARALQDQKSTVQFEDFGFEVQKSLVDDFPENPNYRFDYASTLSKRAIRYRDAGRLAEAEEAYSSAIELIRPLAAEFPNVELYAETFSKLLLDLASILHQQGRKVDAVKHLHNAIKFWGPLIKSNPLEAAKSTTFKELGNALKDAGLKEEAKRVFRNRIDALTHAVAMHPTVAQYKWDKFHAQRMHGFTSLELNLRSEAIKSFEDASATIAKLATDHPSEPKYQTWLRDHLTMFTRLVGDQSHNGRQDGNGNERDFGAYLRPFDQAVEQSPDDSHVWNRRGTIHFNLKRWSAAASDFARAAELAPHRRVIYRSWASSLWPQQRWQQAADVLVEAVNLDLTLDGWRERYELALCALAAGDTARYRDVCDLNLAVATWVRDPLQKNFAAWSSALADRGTDQYDAAVDLANKAVNSQPDNEQFINTLGAVLFRAGRYDEALQTLTALTNRQPQPDQKANSSPAYSWYFLAMTHGALGNRDEAKEWLQKADQRTTQVLEDEQQQTPWNRRLTLKLLRNEAHSLVRANGQISNDPPVLSEPTTAEATEFPLVYGRLQALQGNWSEALDKYDGNIDVNRKDGSLVEYACLLLLTGGNDEYMQLCKQLAGRTIESHDWLVPYVMARTCGIDLAAGVDQQQLIDWAEAAVARNSKAWTLHVLGLAYFRAGDFDRAIEELERSNAMRWDELSIIQNWLVLAMAHHQLQQDQQALQWLQRSNSALAKFGAAGGSAPIEVFTSNWLVLQVLQREASALIFNADAFERLIASKEESNEPWIARAVYHRKYGQWDQAIADFQRVIGSMEIGSETNEYACLLLLEGKRGAFSRLCQELWDQLHESLHDPQVTHQLIKICSLHPESPVDRQQMLRVAHRAHEQHPSNYSLFTLAKAQLRAGEYAEATNSLQTCIHEIGFPEWRVAPLMAIARFHQERPDDAKAWLEKSRTRIERAQQRNNAWTSALTQVYVYYKEATELLEN